MYYRFIIGSDTDQETMIGFTIHADNEQQAIEKAQTFVDALKQTHMADPFAGDLDEVNEAIDVSIYANENLVITDENIEDEWTDEEHNEGRE